MNLIFETYWATRDDTSYRMLSLVIIYQLPQLNLTRVAEVLSYE